MWCRPQLASHSLSAFHPARHASVGLAGRHGRLADAAPNPLAARRATLIVLFAQVFEEEVGRWSVAVTPRRPPAEPDRPAHDPGHLPHRHPRSRRQARHHPCRRLVADHAPRLRRRAHLGGLRRHPLVHRAQRRRRTGPPRARPALVPGADSPACDVPTAAAGSSPTAPARAATTAPSAPAPTPPATTRIGHAHHRVDAIRARQHPTRPRASAASPTCGRRRAPRARRCTSTRWRRGDLRDAGVPRAVDTSTTRLRDRPAGRLRPQPTEQASVEPDPPTSLRGGRPSAAHGPLGRTPSPSAPAAGSARGRPGAAWCATP